MTKVEGSAMVPLPHLRHLQLLLEPADTQSFPEYAVQDMLLSRLNSTYHTSTLECLTILTNTYQNGHFDVVKSIAKNANVYIPTKADVDLKASRAVPWRRCTNMW